MAAAISFPNLQVISESLAPVGGFINGCGQAATLMMSHIVNGTPVSATNLTNSIKLGIVTGHATTSGSHQGSTTPLDLQWLAAQQGVKTQIGSGAHWQSTADTSLPEGRPVVVGVNKAYNLGGSDANVKGHYFTLVGKTTDGRYIVADPNQQAAKSGGTVVYSAQQINSAAPFATLVPVGESAPTHSETGVTTYGSSAGGPEQYQVGPLWPGGPTIGLDPLVDGIIRGSLIIFGVGLIFTGIVLFLRKDIEAAAPGTAEAVLAA